MNMEAVSLTSLSPGGGCGCKIAPAVLNEILGALPEQLTPKELLVGLETGDDAAVYQLNDSQAVVATTDFFMPIVDDPFDFGRIAATNALSDVYAVGAQPIMALAILGAPLDKLSLDVIGQITAGGASVCKEAGIVISGGHSIDSLEPIYGLAALGIVHPDHVKRNASAEAGDVLILGKPLGVGILSAAFKKGDLDAEGYAEMIEATTKLNAVGMELAKRSSVHAMTDVTGFGLLGHLLEICRGSGLGATVRFADVPTLLQARELSEAGYVTGAFERNWASYGAEVVLPQDMKDWENNILCDPQTSGGLLIACDPAEADIILNDFSEAGFASATIVGEMTEGAALVTIL